MRLTFLFISIVVSTSVPTVMRAADVPFSYVAPSTGFNYQYSASSGFLPDASNPAWVNDGYDSSKAMLATDGITGEPVLFLDNSIGNTFANYSLFENGGNGTNSDLITMDFRFRLLANSSTPQFSLSIVRPPTSFQSASAATEQLYYLQFSRDNVSTLQNDRIRNTRFSLGNNWHDARLTLDVEMGRAKIYIDGSLTPIVAWRGSGSAANSRNFTQFGDGSSSVAGHVELSHLKWSNDVLAVPMEDGTGIAGNVEMRRSLEITDRRTLFTNNDPAGHINFPFATRFDDGTLWMYFEEGRHVLEPAVPHSWISTDNGNTWKDAPFAISPSNVHQFAPGDAPRNAANQEMRIMSVSMTEVTTPSTRHVLYLNRWTSADGPKEIIPGGSGRYVDFPFATTVFSHRSLIELDDGALLQTLYGQAAGDSKERSMLIRSVDKGNSWQYLSTIGYTSATSEGFVEPAIVQLADGSLLALLRSGGNSSIWQARSDDGGLTWFDHHAISQQFGSVDPDIIVLQNGVLVASAGRPKGVFLLVDYTGTGDHWQTVEILNADHLTSGYTSLLEVEPNKVMLLYDWSGLSSSNLPNAELPNRLMSSIIAINIPEPGGILVSGAALALYIRRRRPSDVRCRLKRCIE